MSANLVANVTISGNTLVLAASSNVQYINAASSNIFTFAAGIATVNKFPAVAGGQQHTAVLLADGTVRTFGGNAQGQLGLGDTTQRVVPVTVPGIAGATAVSCGHYHTAVLLVDGTVRTFGNNTYGQLGVGDTATRFTPVQVFSISSSAMAVACGGYHTAVLLADGTVRTFGLAGQGQLGANSIVQQSLPLQVWGISSSATAIACGYLHTAVVLANGTVRTFGYNLYGQLGVNDTSVRYTPVQVFEISSSAVAVACGNHHTAVLLAGGTVRTFGYNTRGGLGVNDTTDRLTPVQVFGISSSATAVACGGQYTAVLLADGTVRTFGRNTNGGLGVNDTTDRSTPVQVFGISSSAVALGCGIYHSTLILTDGTLRTFGFNTYGGLGLGDTASRLTPVQVVSALSYSGGVGKVAGGAGNSAVILADGTVRTFGNNGAGQLGVNDNTQRSTPVQVWGISSSATAVACGSAGYTAVLLANGTVMIFGYNSNGNLGVNDNATRQTPVQVFGISSSAVAVACGLYHTAVVLADGTLRTFGDNAQSQLGINVTSGTRQTPVQVFGISSSAVSVTCGLRHTVVLLANGTVLGFGSNSLGQLGIDAAGGTRQTPVQVVGISTATAVASAGYHTVVLLSNGTVRTFGYNLYGNLGVNDNTNRLTPVQVWGISSSAIAIACGYMHTSVLLADGTVRTFGYNNRGQLGINVTGETRSTLVQVLNITNAVAIAVCVQGYHNVVLLADGTVRTFGQNSAVQLGVGDATTRQTPVTVFNMFTGGSLASTTFLTGAAQTSFTFNGPVFTTNLGLGRVPDISYQLDLSSDGARKLQSSTWTTGSDRRIKSDIQTANLARCAEIVDSLDLKYFEWLSAEHTDRHSLGWIAQDVLTFFPKSVSLTEAGTLALDSDQLVKVLWGALKHTLNEHFAPPVPEPVPEVPVAPVATETVVESVAATETVVEPVATTEPVAEVTEVPAVAESLSEPVTEVTEPVAEVPEVTEVPAVPEVTEVPVATESLSVDPGTEASESLSENTVEVPEVPATSDADPGTEASEPVPEVPAAPESVPE